MFLSCVRSDVVFFAFNPFQAGAVAMLVTVMRICEIPFCFNFRFSVRNDFDALCQEKRSLDVIGVHQMCSTNRQNRSTAVAQAR